MEIKLADAALKLLTKTAWRDLTLAQVAKAARIPLSQLQDLRGGKSALVGLILMKIGAETAKRYERESDTARERLFDVALAWFETQAKRKAAIRSLARSARCIDCGMPFPCCCICCIIWLSILRSACCCC